MPKIGGQRTDQTKTAYRSSRWAGGSWDAIETRRTLGTEGCLSSSHAIKCYFIILKTLVQLTLSPFSPSVPGNPMGPLWPYNNKIVHFKKIVFPLIVTHLWTMSLVKHWKRLPYVISHATRWPLRALLSIFSLWKKVRQSYYIVYRLQSYNLCANLHMICYWKWEFTQLLQRDQRKDIKNSITYLLSRFTVFSRLPRQTFVSLKAAINCINNFALLDLISLLSHLKVPVLWSKFMPEFLLLLKWMFISCLQTAAVVFHSTSSL